MKAALMTLGCKVNQYDTQAMSLLFEKAGYEIVDFDATADIYVINTCTVTHISDRKSRQMISRAHMQNEKALIAVTGCYAQRAADEVLSLPGVKLVLGTKDRKRIVDLVESVLHEGGKINAVGDIGKVREFEEMPITRDGRTRAYLKIEDGCNNFCAYCVIPYVRGRVRSRPLADIETQTRMLAGEGYKEIVLTGINLASYGSDSGCKLLDAVKIVCNVNGIERVRLGSLESVVLDQELIDFAAQQPKVCRHFHISVQSGSRSVLERMNRHYTPEQYMSAVENIRGVIPDAAITTDVIVGFPGETRQEFEQTAQFIENVGFSSLHVFPYSQRSGTKAATMPGQIDFEEKQKRLREIVDIRRRLEEKYLSRFLGKTEKVLFEEQNKSGVIQGHTDTYILVSAQGGEQMLGMIKQVRLEKIIKGGMAGMVIE